MSEQTSHFTATDPKPSDEPCTSRGAATGSLTPAMRQYAEQKARVGDAVLLFRMGDFYETFYDDAVLCAKTLGIALTSRSRDGDTPIPLAGIPHHALETYLRKLTIAGFKVAISEQMEDARTAKGVIRRDVVRIVTAGTLTDEALLDDRDRSVLACITSDGEKLGVAWLELAAARFETADAFIATGLDLLAPLRPAELVISVDAGPQEREFADTIRDVCGAVLTRVAADGFHERNACETLCTHFGVAGLEGFGYESWSLALSAAGAALTYLRATQQSSTPLIRSMKRRNSGDYLQIDHGTFRSLEIDRTLRTGSKLGALREAVDRTVHPHGARKLCEWLCFPPAQLLEIHERQGAVSYLLDDELGRSRIRSVLGRIADLERIASRLGLGRSTARDLASLGRSIHALSNLSEILADVSSTALRNAGQCCTGFDELGGYLARAVVEAPAGHPRDGVVIADGFDAELDRLRSLAKDAQQWLLEFQRRESTRVGLPNLKVGYNRVFGYYIEIAQSLSDRVPPDYVRRQTVKNADRYICDELKRFEAEVLTARERSIERECDLLDQVKAQAAQHVSRLLELADALARVDCLAGFAELAKERRYVRPEFVDENVFRVEEGRHPVLDQTLEGRFVPNDTVMSQAEGMVLIITGPNMAGKSTFIRQAALLALLAHVGSYVPARSMTLGRIDRLFARVGSADELARGQSTFMVEMMEASNILRNATDRSFIVLDELGRGTSTFDGLSLAWAIAEHLANLIGSRTLIATHYHELIRLAESARAVRNYNVAVREYPATEGREGGIVFLHRIVEGGASRSYGLHVARLAGIPPEVIRRSREVLDQLQSRQARAMRAIRKAYENDAVPLFGLLEAGDGSA